MYVPYFSLFNIHSHTSDGKNSPILTTSVNHAKIRVAVKNGNRNDRIRNGNDGDRKWSPNFLHKITKNLNLCGKLRGHFRFRSFPFRIRSFRFPFFTETPKIHRKTFIVNFQINWSYFCYVLLQITVTDRGEKLRFRPSSFADRNHCTNQICSDRLKVFTPVYGDNHVTRNSINNARRSIKKVKVLT